MIDKGKKGKQFAKPYVNNLASPNMETNFPHHQAQLKLSYSLFIPLHRPANHHMTEPVHLRGAAQASFSCKVRLQVRPRFAA